MYISWAHLSSLLLFLITTQAEQQQHSEIVTGTDQQQFEQTDLVFVQSKALASESFNYALPDDVPMKAPPQRQFHGAAQASPTANDSALGTKEMGAPPLALSAAASELSVSEPDPRQFLEIEYLFQEQAQQEGEVPHQGVEQAKPSSWILTRLAKYKAAYGLILLALIVVVVLVRLMASAPLMVTPKQFLPSGAGLRRLLGLGSGGRVNETEKDTSTTDGDDGKG